MGTQSTSIEGLTYEKLEILISTSINFKKEVDRLKKENEENIKKYKSGTIKISYPDGFHSDRVNFFVEDYIGNNVLIEKLSNTNKHLTELIMDLKTKIKEMEESIIEVLNY
jgi:hypothetical protein